MLSPGRMRVFVVGGSFLRRALCILVCAAVVSFSSMWRMNACKS